MNRSFLLVISFVMVSLAGARPASAQDSNAGSRPDFNSFQVIERNNIFNPSRRPPRGRPITPVVRVYTFTLNGTMTYENKGYAFFDGNSVNRGQVYAPSDTINGYKIAEITNNTVKLAAASNQFITLRVGMQMRKEEKGPWKLVGSSLPASESTSSGSTDAASGEGSGDGAAASVPVSVTPGADADVMARLMKRRREENGDTNSAPVNGDQNQ